MRIRPALVGVLALLPLTACGHSPAPTSRPVPAATARGLDAAAVHRAERGYAGYVRREADRLLTRTQAFAAAFASGRATRARALYPLARSHWERIEPVAEAFGDLDPRLDLREADLQQGQRWTGWHRAEKDLWAPRHGYTPLTVVERRAVAADLLADTRRLQRQVRQGGYDAVAIATGAKGLLDEVAGSKITGEEDVWSHTDLYDVEANVDGARAAFDALAPLVREKDPTLVGEIRRRFAALQEQLAEHRTRTGRFPSYRTVSGAQRKLLSDRLNALAEPLATVAAVLTA